MQEKAIARLCELAPAARGSQEAGFTHPRSDPCSSSSYSIDRAFSHGIIATMSPHAIAVLSYSSSKAFANQLVNVDHGCLNARYFL